MREALGLQYTGGGGGGGLADGGATVSAPTFTLLTCCGALVATAAVVWTHSKAHNVGRRKNSRDGCVLLPFEHVDRGSMDADINKNKRND